MPEIDPQAWQRSPVVGIRDAAANGERIVRRGVPGGAFSYTTGGSGQPLIFHYGRAR